MTHSYNLRTAVTKHPSLAKGARSVWQRLIEMLVMDGPIEWDIHPDVARKLMLRARIARQIG